MVTAALLYTFRVVSERTLFLSILNWPPDAAQEAVGSLAASVHSLLLLPALFVALTSQPYQLTGHMKTTPKWWQDLVTAELQFCTGYMIYDSFASYFVPKGILSLQGTDYLFLGHHLATIVYMTQCRYVQAGHTSAMMCMLLGEFTNPFQNANIILNLASKFYPDSIWIAAADSTIEFGFAFFYFAIRAIIMPIFFVQVTYQLLFAETRINIPFAMRLWWIFSIFVVEVGSYDWIVESWRILLTYMPGNTSNDDYHGAADNDMIRKAEL